MKLSYDFHSIMLNLIFLITVSLELMTASEMEECCKAYTRRTGAKNSREDRIPVEQVFRRRPAFRSPSPRAYICTVLFRSLYLLMSTTFAHRFSERDRYRIYASKDFLRGNPICTQLRIKRVVVATAKSSLIVSRLGKLH